MTASCASSLPTRPVATPAAYCAVMEIAISGLTVVGETWREPPPFPPPQAGEGRVGAHCIAHAKIAQSNSRERFTSHAYTECRHVAQCFTLPNFGAARHDDLIRRAREDIRSTNELASRQFAARRETIGRVSQTTVSLPGRQCQETQCRTFFQKAA